MNYFYELRIVLSVMAAPLSFDRLAFNRCGNIFLIRELKHAMILNRTLAIPSI